MVTNVIVDVLDHEEFVNNLQHDHREFIGCQDEEEIKAILREARQRKGKRKR